MLQLINSYQIGLQMFRTFPIKAVNTHWLYATKTTRDVTFNKLICTQISEPTRRAFWGKFDLLLLLYTIYLWLATYLELYEFVVVTRSQFYGTATWCCFQLMPALDLDAFSHSTNSSSITGPKTKIVTKLPVKLLFFTYTLHRRHNLTDHWKSFAKTLEYYTIGLC